MLKLSKLGLGLLVVLAVAQVSVAKTSAGSPNSKGPANTACESRNNNSTGKLVECIRQDYLWRHLVDFQQIAEANPGPDGHPSRSLGEPGYLASVNYVKALMQAAGYRVSVQEYTFPYFNFTGWPSFGEVSPTPSSYALRADWSPATYSGSGNVTAAVQPVGGIIIPATIDPSSTSGCSAADFAGFVAGNIALIQRGWCGYDTKAYYAEAAGAIGVIIFNEGNPGRTAAPGWGYLDAYNPPSIPVALSSYSVGANLYAQYNSAQNPVAHIDVQAIYDPYRADYNLIADSPFGDPNHVVVLDAHLDAIYGAGILDNASGSTTILEVALKMAHTPTRNQLRYIWFGGEELGIYGSQNYAFTLSPEQAQQIVFDLDADVTATPNYTTAIADPANSVDAAYFPPNVVPGSQVGNNYFVQYFTSNGLPYVDWSNDGTDSWSFSLIGVPNSGILTGQDCCKSQYEVDLFGGYLGNYEGNIPSYDGGFVDRPFLWGDNLDNNDPKVLEATSKAYAYVAWQLANDRSLAPAASAAPAQYRMLTPRHAAKMGGDR
ncbi:MAG: M28 family peptidase [Rudaea sp.]